MDSTSTRRDRRFGNEAADVLAGPRSSGNVRGCPAPRPGGFVGPRRPGKIHFPVAFLAGLIALGNLNGCVSPGGAPPASFRPAPPPPLKLLTRRPFADPSVFHRGDWYYVFGTGTKFFRTKTFAPGDKQWFTLHLDYGAAKTGVFDFWAFQVYKDADGSYHGYAAVHYAFFRTVVAHFLPAPGEVWTDDHPITRWRLDKILVGNIKLGHFAYDPEVVRDDNGDLFLFYCAGDPEEVSSVDIHIKVRRLLDPGTVDPAFAPRSVLSPGGYRSEDRNPGFVQILEGPRIRKIQGKWVLLYSVGDFSGCNYKLGAAFSDVLVPPPGDQYQKVLIADPKNLWKNTGRKREICYLLQSEQREWPNFIGDSVCGPGIGNLVNLNGAEYLIFHGRFFNREGKPSAKRHLWKLPVQLDLSPDRPMCDWIRPVLP